MSEFRIVRHLHHPIDRVWRALTDPELVPRWTTTGRGGTPEGFGLEVGRRFRFVGRPTIGWDGIVRCVVLEVAQPRLLRYSWQGAPDGPITQVTYLLEPSASGTLLSFSHAGFHGLGGLVMARLLGRVRRKMLDRAFAPLLDELALTDVAAQVPAVDRTARGTAGRRLGADSDAAT